jgi:hypothetical protein
MADRRMACDPNGHGGLGHWHAFLRARSFPTLLTGL